MNHVIMISFNCSLSLSRLKFPRLADITGSGTRRDKEGNTRARMSLKIEKRWREDGDGSFGD